MFVNPFARRLVGLVLIAAALVACGKKGPPRPQPTQTVTLSAQGLTP